MHEAAEFFAKFQQLLQSGLNACLNLECRAGHAWVQLQVALPPPPPHHYQYQHFQHSHKPSPSPSRKRRRAKRAQARAKAASAVKTAADSSEASTQTNENPAESVDVAVQVTATDKLDELGHQVPPVYLPDEVCHDHVYQEAAGQADLHSQLFTPNHVYTEPQYQAIPQLDGISPENQTSLVFHSKNHPYFTSYSHTQSTSTEERRKDREKNLEDIKKMIEGSFRF